MYKKEQVCVIFCLNRNDKKCNYRCFLVLNFELSFLKRFNLVSKIIFCRLLSRFFQIRIMNFLRAIYNRVSFFRLRFLTTSIIMDFLTLTYVFNDIKILLHFVSLVDSGLSFTNF